MLGAATENPTMYVIGIVGIRGVTEADLVVCQGRRRPF